MKEEKDRATGAIPEGGAKKEAPDDVAGSGSGEDCRCKEVARKTPGELLKIMLSDFAFWRKKG